MAKDNSSREPARPQRSSTRPRREKEVPEKPPDRDLTEPDENRGEENPEWWRGDPGKPGEVL